jgi:heat shock protein HslJ
MKEAAMRAGLLETSLVMLMLCGCAGQAESLQADAASGAGARGYLAGDFSALEGEWVVSKVEGGPGDAGAPITLSLKANGEFAGSAGCNRYFGKFSPAEGKLVTGPMGATRMACEGSLMTMEDRYLALLSRVTRIDKAGERLLLKDQDTQVLLELVRVAN